MAGFHNLDQQQQQQQQQADHTVRKGNGQDMLNALADPIDAAYHADLKQKFQ